jgi:hypothetical protein
VTARRPDRWWIATVEPTALFSLRPSATTSAGGKTLLLPTPYAVKAAILDAIYRADGVPAAQAVFPALKCAAVALLPPERLAVTNTFMRAMRMARDDGAEEGSGDGNAPRGQFGSTLLYREVCCFGGALEIGIAMPEPDERVRSALWRLSSLGRRGGFVQVVDVRTDVAPHPLAVVVDPEGWQPERLAGQVVAQLDDFGPGLTIDVLSPFSEADARWDRDRVMHFRILPLRMVGASRHFTRYERISYA